MIDTYLCSQTTIPYTEDGRNDLTVEVIEAKNKQGEVIGRLRLEVDGTCYGIWVAEDYRRQGIATKLWEFAELFQYEPKHTAERTIDGNEWAKSLNQELPEWVRV